MLGGTDPYSHLTEQEKQALIKKLQAQVDDTKEVAVDNIGQIVERGEKLQGIADTTRQTEEQALEFTGNARQMYIKARFQNWALSAAILGMLFGAAYAFSVGASMPMVLASTGMAGVMFYGVMWMASGLIQSVMSLPFFSMGFESGATVDDHPSNNLTTAMTPQLSDHQTYLTAFAPQAPPNNLGLPEEEPSALNRLLPKRPL